VPRLSHRLSAILVPTFMFLAAGNALAATEAAYKGTVGPAGVGMTLTLKGSAGISGGHYFYTRYHKDIRLTGNMQGGQLLLHEASGGTFTLHFVGNGSEHGQPLDFNNSVGLAGTWSDGTKSLPVKLDLSGMNEVADSGAGSARRYADVTSETDAAFEARVAAFQKAALAGDQAATAHAVSFPLRVNRNGSSKTIANAAQLSAAWNSIFTPAFLAALRKAAPHDLFVRNGQAMLGEDGVAWFGPKGADSLNIP
jgi:hypothetical protein